VDFEIVGCEDPLDTNVSGKEGDRFALKTDNDFEPTDGLPNKEQDNQPLQEVFESRSIRHVVVITLLWATP